jgi:hypothetical protein
MLDGRKNTMVKLPVILVLSLIIVPNLWGYDDKPKILGQNSDGSLHGIMLEQKIGCGPRSCLANIWQDLNADGLVDIVSLYVVWKHGKLQLIMQEFLIRKTNRI